MQTHILLCNTHSFTQTRTHTHRRTHTGTHTRTNSLTLSPAYQAAWEGGELRHSGSRLPQGRFSGHRAGALA